MKGYALHLRGLRKAYPSRSVWGWGGEGQQALVGADLAIPSGSVWALVGHNGAGKTTLLHCLMGLVHPSAGTVALFDAGVSPKEARARVGFLPELFVPYPTLTVDEHLTLYGRLSGMSHEVLATRLQDVVRRLELTEVVHRRAEELSKGTVQRLGLAQSLLHAPELVVWDEPSSGLDPTGRVHLVKLAHEVKASGATLLLATHILADVDRCCDGVTVLHRGRVLANGTLAELHRAHGTTSAEALFLRLTSPDGQHAPEVPHAG